MVCSPVDLAAGQRLTVSIAGFGLGALNDADEDDLDVYDRGDDLGARRRMAFDAEEVEETITIGLPSTKSSKQQPAKAKVSHGLMIFSKPVTLTRRLAVLIRNFSRWSASSLGIHSC